MQTTCRCLAVVGKISHPTLLDLGVGTGFGIHSSRFFFLLRAPAGGKATLRVQAGADAEVQQGRLRASMVGRALRQCSHNSNSSMRCTRKAGDRHRMRRNPSLPALGGLWRLKCTLHCTYCFKCHTILKIMCSPPPKIAAGSSQHVTEGPACSHVSKSLRGLRP